MPIKRQNQRSLVLKSGAARQQQGSARAMGAEMRQQNRWEQQADQAATRILRGEQNIGTQLTPIRAASYSLASSLGQPLPASVRSELETGFGADLSAVRIHSNAYAAAAARQERARAFAAGRDIYFGQGEFQPASESGKRLLIHEVAHVLQQTGRREQSRTKATNVKGNAGIQKKVSFVEQLRKRGFFAKFSNLDDVITRYKGIENFDHHRAFLEKELHAPLSPVIVHEKTKTQKFQAASDEVKSLYVDALKFVGQYEIAREILVKNPGLLTSFRSSKFYSHIRKQGVAWIDEIVKTHTLTKKYYPYWFIKTFKNFFLSPGLKPVRLDHEKVEKKLAAELSRIKDKKGQVENELQVATLFALYQLIKKRREKFEAELKRFRTEGKSLIVSHQRIAKHYSKGKAKKRSPARYKESKALFAKVFPGIKKEAELAFKHWDRVLKLKRAFDWNKISGEQKQKIIRGIDQSKEFDTFRKTLLETGNQLFAKSDGNILTQQVFHKRIRRARSKIEGLMAALGFKLANSLKKDNSQDDKIMQLGLVMAILDEARSTLLRYNNSQDRTMSKAGFQDIRFGMRIRLASFLQRIAIRLRWKELLRIANKVFEEKTQLALLDSWESAPQKNQFGQLSEELGGEFAWLKNTGISGRLLDHFLRMQYFEEIGFELVHLLSVHKNNIPENLSLLNQAFQKAVKEQSPPRKYIVKEWEINSNQGVRSLDKPEPATITIKNIYKEIFKHTLTKKFLDREEKQNELSIAPVKIKTSEPLFLWIIPKMDDFIKFIGQIDEVNDTVREYWKATHDQQQEMPNPIDDPWGWFNILEKLIKDDSKAATKIKEEKLGPLSSKIKEEINLGLKSATLIAKSKAREVTKLQLKPLLRKFTQETFHLKGTELMVFQIIKNFASFVKTQNQKSHVGALVLEIAEELMEAFGPKDHVILGTFHLDHFRIAGPVFNLINGTLQQWKEEQAKPKPHDKEAAAAHNSIASISSLSLNELKKRVKTLEKIEKSLAGQIRKWQKRRGLMGDTNSRSLKSVYFEQHGSWFIKQSAENPDFDLKEGMKFIVGNRWVTIIKIHNTFRFYPSYIHPQNLGVDWPKGEIAGSEILFVDHQQVKSPSNQALFTVKEKKNGKEKKITITAGEKDRKKLVEYSTYLEAHLTGEYIGGALTFVNEFAKTEAELLITAVPGVGQAALAAEIVAGVIQFIASPEFEAIKNLLRGDVTDLIKKVETKLEELFTPSGMIDLLLFGHPFLTTLAELGTSDKLKKNRRISRKTKNSKLGRLVGNILKLGKGISGTLGKLQNHVQLPVKNLQTFIALRPGIGEVIEFAIRHAYLLENVNSIPSLPGQKELKGKVENSAKDFGNQFSKVLNGIQEVKLPKEIVPLAPLSRLVTDLVLNRMSKKIKMSKKIIFIILDKTGRSDLIFNELAKQITGKKGDPNLYWKNFTEEHIDTKMQAAAQDLMNEFVAMLNGLTDGAFGKAVNIKKGKSATEEEFDDPELRIPQLFPYRKSAAEVEMPSEPIDLPQGARPLPPSVREKAEKDFGHDFSHVRILAGGEAEDFADGFGAEGLTTGSFIFLRSDAQLVGNRKILYHELAHVLQQTGARPKDQLNSNYPTLGKPNKGLEYETAREKSAEEMAQAALGAQERTEPIDIGTPGVNGLNPLPAGGIRKFLRKLNSFSEVEQFKKLIEKQSEQDVPKDSLRYKHAMLIWKGLKYFMKKKIGKKNFNAEIQGGHQMIVKYFNDNVAGRKGDKEKISDNLIRKIASAALSSKTKKVKGVEEEVFTFHANRFLRGLENILLIKSGIGMILTLSRSNIQRMGKGKELANSVDKTNIFEKVMVKGLFLPSIGGNAQIWIDSMKTFGKDNKPLRRVIRNTLKNYGLGSEFTGTDHKNVEKTITILETKNGKFRFSDDFKKYIELLQSSPNKPKDVPPVAKYIKHKDPVNPYTIGLRIGTYGQHPGSKVDRQSHHTTQFLLVEYFTNKVKNPYHAFRKLDQDNTQGYPGLVLDSKNEPLQFSVEGKKPIKFKDPADGKRGNTMPAILLATRTHMKGKLHIKPITTDDNASKGATQGGAIDTEYYEFFTGALKNSGFKGADKFVRMEKTEANLGKYQNYIGARLKKEEDKNKLKNARYDAIQKTYRWVRNTNIVPLKDALINHEIPYYKEIAELGGKRIGSDGKLLKAYRMNTGHMNTIYTAAEKNNDKIMKAKGWIN